MSITKDPLAVDEVRDRISEAINCFNPEEWATVDVDGDESSSIGIVQPATGEVWLVTVRRATLTLVDHEAPDE